MVGWQPTGCYARGRQTQSRSSLPVQCMAGKVAAAVTAAPAAKVAGEMVVDSLAVVATALVFWAEEAREAAGEVAAVMVAAKVAVVAMGLVGVEVAAMVVAVKAAVVREVAAAAAARAAQLAVAQRADNSGRGNRRCL